MLIRRCRPTRRARGLLHRARFGLDPQSPRVRLLSPMGLFDFVKLERTAHCVLSDSGTVGSVQYSVGGGQ